MKPNTVEVPRLELHLARLLHHGTWLASAIIAAGLVVTLVQEQSAERGVATMPIVLAGIAIFILLPVFRVVLMLIVFVRERDYRFAAVALIVLSIVVAGFLVGMFTRRGVG